MEGFLTPNHAHATVLPVTRKVIKREPALAKQPLFFH